MGDLNSKGYILVLQREVGLTVPVAAAKGTDLKLTGAFMCFPFHGFLLSRLIKITSLQHLFQLLLVQFGSNTGSVEGPLSMQKKIDNLFSKYLGDRMYPLRKKGSLLERVNV